MVQKEWYDETVIGIHFGYRRCKSRVESQSSTYDGNYGAEGTDDKTGIRRCVLRCTGLCIDINVMAAMEQIFEMKA